jgi:endonuclease YncB( thermonuclease family)
MQIVSTCLAAVVAVSQFLASSWRSEPVLVTSVIDGRTLQVQSVGRVRLLGIEPAGGSNQAKGRLSDLVAHRWVRLEYEGKPRQASAASRSAYVWTEDGRFVNDVLVREGLARVVGGKDSPRSSDLREAEADARVHERGLWSGRGIREKTQVGGPRNTRKTQITPSIRRASVRLPRSCEARRPPSRTSAGSAGDR